MCIRDRAETIQRENAIYDRFLKYYGIKNVNDPKHFDLIIDTTHVTPEEIAEKIISGLKENKMNLS